jgi:hypothetical protein
VGAAAGDARPAHRAGKRDLALLHLLGSAGLRRAEAANLLIADVGERRRASDPRLRAAVARSTRWWVTVRYGERGRTRAIPLDQVVLVAIAAWVKTRPAAGSATIALPTPSVTPTHCASAPPASRSASSNAASATATPRAPPATYTRCRPPTNAPRRRR